MVRCAVGYYRHQNDDVMVLMYPQIDPVLIHVGPVAIHWYGIMYLVGLGIAWSLGKRRIDSLNVDLSHEQWDDLIFYGLLGVVLGGRLGYMLFYKSADLIHQPLDIFKVWQGGMSFHGGLLGALGALWLFSRRINRPFLQVTDFIAPLVPPGLGFGRLGNFINGELVGRPTDRPWGMVFPDIDFLPRHPSQLYEMALEGIVLFVILMIYSRKPRNRGVVSGLFLLCYGIFRFALEFFRQPDSHLGFVAFQWLTMGQLLSIPLMVGGLWLLVGGFKWSNI